MNLPLKTMRVETEDLMLLFWSALFIVGRVVRWANWEGSEVVRWEMWESSKVARWERWESGEVGKVGGSWFYSRVGDVG